MSKVTDIIEDIVRIDSIESTANAAAPSATTLAGYGITDAAAKDNPTFTGIVSGITASMVGAEPADATILKEADIGVVVLPKTNPSITGSITEQTATATDVLEPDNGTIQTYTATGDVTFTDGLADGQFLTLILTNGGNAITYPTITWWGDEAPTLGTTDKLFFEKIGGVLYGSHVGSIA
jgi:hypothetical protein